VLTFSNYRELVRPKYGRRSGANWQAGPESEILRSGTKSLRLCRMKTVAKRPRATNAATAPDTPADRKTLVAKFAREFMVKPGEPTFAAVGGLLRRRGHSR
jgi:hypothetical protein